MTSNVEKTSGEDGSALAISVGYYPYHYNVVKMFSDIPALRQEDIAKGASGVAMTLSELFLKHGIKEVSLTPLNEAIQIADKWLQDGDVDEEAVKRVRLGASQQLDIIQPVVKEIFESGQVDENFVGGPLVLAAIGNAIDLVKNTLIFSQVEAVNTPEIRAAIVDSIHRQKTKSAVPGVHLA